MTNEIKIQKAINKAVKEYPQAIIWGALLFPANNSEEEFIVVYGDRCELEWQNTLIKNGIKGINYYQLVTIFTKDLKGE